MSEPHPTPVPPAAIWHRRIVAALALVSLIMAGVWMTVISRTDPWYRNLDMNIHNTADALAINADIQPNLIDQPGVPMKLLLALDFRLRHRLGWLPVWNLKTFGDSPDPLRELPALIRIGRVHSRILVLAFILAAAWLTHTVTRARHSAALTIILLCGSFALLFHGLLTRPELLCVGFGNILALGCTWRAVEARRWPGKYGWLFLAGLFGGLSALEKLPGVCYLALCYSWCWLGALTTREPTAEPTAASAAAGGFWRGLLPAAGGLCVLVLLFHLLEFQDVIGPVPILRLRVAAVLIGLLPLLALANGGCRPWRFLLERSHELSLLGTGALASLPLTYLIERTVMPEAHAQDYLARMLHYVVDPSTAMKTLIDNPDVSQVFLRHVQQNPVLFLGATVFAAIIFRLRPVPLRLKAFIALLWITGLGMTLVMSRRHFTMHYSIFLQVPLLLVWSLSLCALADWLRDRHPATAAARWGLPVAAGLAFVFVLTVYPRLQYNYQRYQDDAKLPLNDLSLTFLFDHDVHTATYLRIMREHYGDREQFARTLEQYLADPKNRY